jgi:hypothetical protein
MKLMWQEMSERVKKSLMMEDFELLYIRSPGEKFWKTNMTNTTSEAFAGSGNSFPDDNSNKPLHDCLR